MVNVQEMKLDFDSRLEPQCSAESRSPGKRLYRIDMGKIATFCGTLCDGMHFIDLSTAEKCLRWFDPDCSFYLKVDGEVVKEAGDDLRRAYNFAKFDNEVLLAINVPGSAWKDITP